MSDLGLDDLSLSKLVENASLAALEAISSRLQASWQGTATSGASTCGEPGREAAELGLVSLKLRSPVETVAVHLSQGSTVTISTARAIHQLFDLSSIARRRGHVWCWTTGGVACTIHLLILLHVLLLRL